MGIKAGNWPEMVPGALYVECFTNHYGDGQNLYERLFWYGGDGRCYDADSGDEIRPVGDEFIRQAGAFSQEHADFVREPELVRNYA